MCHCYQPVDEVASCSQVRKQAEFEKVSYREGNSAEKPFVLGFADLGVHAQQPREVILLLMARGVIVRGILRRATPDD